MFGSGVVVRRGPAAAAEPESPWEAPPEDKLTVGSRLAIKYEDGDRCGQWRNVEVVREPDTSTRKAKWMGMRYFKARELDIQRWASTPYYIHMISAWGPPVRPKIIDVKDFLAATVEVAAAPAAADAPLKKKPAAAPAAVDAPKQWSVEAWSPRSASTPRTAYRLRKIESPLFLT